jgi:5-methylcytosine-specific restriction endonuclease McrA
MSLALNQPVLVLNRLWQAVNVCPARRALSLLFEGQAQVVCSDPSGDFHTYDFCEWRDFSGVETEEDPREVVRTVSLKLRVPRVILLMAFDRMPRKEVKFTRHNIFERDRNTCQYSTAGCNWIGRT